MLLQDLHDSHVCNSLLVAESDEDIWKNESLYKKRINTSDGEIGHVDSSFLLLLISEALHLPSI